MKAFKNFLEDHGENHEAVADFSIDMSPAFISGIEEHFPESRIIFDKFHVTKFMNVALDKVCRAEQTGNKDLRKTRYIWFKNPENLLKKQEETRPVQKRFFMTGRTLKTKSSY